MSIKIGILLMYKFVHEEFVRADIHNKRRCKVIVMPRNLIQMVSDRCRKDGDKTAFLVKKAGRWNPVTWGEVDRRVERIAAGLRALGVQTGDRVSIMGNTRLEWTLADLGVLRAGGVSVGIYHTLSGEQISYILKDSGSKVLFVESRALSEKVDPHMRELPELKYRVCWDDDLEIADALRLENLEEKGENFLAETPGALKAVENEIDPDDTGPLSSIRPAPPARPRAPV